MRQSWNASSEVIEARIENLPWLSSVAQPGVAALELLHDQAVGDVVQSRAAVPLERRAEDAELAELGDERDRKRAGAMVLGDQRQELGLDPVADRVADHPLFFGQEALDRVVVDAPELLHPYRLRRSAARGTESSAPSATAKVTA